MLRKLHRLFFCGVLLLSAGISHAQQPALEPRIAGLEGNAEYMKLLQEDSQLQFQEDSIVRVVEGLRESLRLEPENRMQHSQHILQFENRIFELRTAKGRLIDRINTIEQNWVLSNLGRIDVPPVAVAKATTMNIPDSIKVRNLVDNLYFREHLPAEDYAALQRAQQLEMEAVEYVNRYYANYQTISDLATSYAQVDTELAALDLFGRYTTLQKINLMLADSLSKSWNYIFDNKSYAYGYLLEKLECDDLLTQETERLADASRKLAAIHTTTSSEAVADYFLRKRVAVEYETAVAEVLKLDAARDSLRGVTVQLAKIDYQLPKVEIEERLFLEYDSVRFSVASQYTYKNPIPECKVYARGTIYRVLLGTFNTKRAADTFRGAYPLCYQINDAGKWLYYAGGYATMTEALDAQKQLKARGFVRPEVVVWIDGVSRNLSLDPEAMAVVYRVEIRGAEALPDAVKSVIHATAEGFELSRVGQQLFVVGSFTDKAVAERLADAVHQADGALEIKVAEIVE